jgi:hypothetical protein
LHRDHLASSKALPAQGISHSTIRHAKAGSWLGDGDFLVTHFDKQIVHVAAQIVLTRQPDDASASHM